MVNIQEKILNFGHTFGHAIEAHNKYKKVSHGEAVAIGMIFEIKISKLLNLKPISIVNLESLLKKYNLPFDYRPYINNKNINNIMKKVYSDKKSFKDNTFNSYNKQLKHQLKILV